MGKNYNCTCLFGLPYDCSGAVPIILLEYLNIEVVAEFLTPFVDTLDRLFD